MADDLSLERVLEEMRNGDTAQALATRLSEPGGAKALHSPRRVVAALQEARRLGRVESRCDWEKEIKPVRWRHLDAPLGDGSALGGFAAGEAQVKSWDTPGAAGATI
jgi:hypothetical protein